MAWNRSDKPLAAFHLAVLLHILPHQMSATLERSLEVVLSLVCPGPGTNACSN